MIGSGITLERIREVMDYDPATGVFIRKVKTGPRHEVGERADKNLDNGYLRIGLDGRKLLAHRVAWLYVHGAWPKGFIDHINGDRSDNRIANLRAANHRINAENQVRAHATNRSGILGVYKFRDHWRARITSRGKVYNLGEFDSQKEAFAAYVTAKRLLHEGCTI
jgi:hypothetical protein